MRSELRPPSSHGIVPLKQTLRVQYPQAGSGQRLAARESDEKRRAVRDRTRFGVDVAAVKIDDKIALYVYGEGSRPVPAPFELRGEQPFDVAGSASHGRFLSMKRPGSQRRASYDYMEMENV